MTTGTTSSSTIQGYWPSPAVIFFVSHTRTRVWGSDQHLDPTTGVGALSTARTCWGSSCAPVELSSDPEDGLNRRVGKKVNGTLTEGFLYDGQLRPVAWLNGSGAVYATFVYGLHVNVPEYMVVGSTTYRFITDHLGSPRL